MKISVCDKGIPSGVGGTISTIALHCPAIGLTYRCMSTQARRVPQLPVPQLARSNNTGMDAVRTTPSATLPTSRCFHPVASASPHDNEVRLPAFALADDGIGDLRPSRVGAASIDQPADETPSH